MGLCLTAVTALDSQRGLHSCNTGLLIQDMTEDSRTRKGASVLEWRLDLLHLRRYLTAVGD